MYKSTVIQEGSICVQVDGGNINEIIKDLEAISLFLCHQI